jgi:hypothetical protein
VALLHVKQLYAGLPTCDGSAHVVATVPAGYRWVVRDMRLLEEAGGTPWTVLYLGPARILNHTLSAYGTWDESVWIVGEPGQTLSWQAASGATVSVIVSGSLYVI